MQGEEKLDMTGKWDARQERVFQRKEPERKYRYFVYDVYSGKKIAELYSNKEQSEAESRVRELYGPGTNVKLVKG